jgi:hypothetical protein
VRSGRTSVKKLLPPQAMRGIWLGLVRSYVTFAISRHKQIKIKARGTTMNSKRWISISIKLKKTVYVDHTIFSCTKENWVNLIVYKTGLQTANMKRGMVTSIVVWQNKMTVWRTYKSMRSKTNYFVQTNLRFLYFNNNLTRFHLLFCRNQIIVEDIVTSFYICMDIIYCRSEALCGIL